MRTDDEYRQILMLWEQGNDQSHIARLTNIPRATVGSSGMTIQIAKRADVAFLDQYIGPKS